jgi:hypothetical protein
MSDVKREIGVRKLFEFPLPPWLKNMSDGPKRWAAENRFRMKLCVLYASESGHARQLAEMIGVKHATLKSQIASKVRASTQTKEGIRNLLGPEFVPPDFPELHRQPKSR